MKSVPSMCDEIWARTLREVHIVSVMVAKKRKRKIECKIIIIKIKIYVSHSRRLCRPYFNIIFGLLSSSRNLYSVLVLFSSFINRHTHAIFSLSLLLSIARAMFFIQRLSTAFKISFTQIQVITEDICVSFPFTGRCKWKISSSYNNNA